MGRADGRSFASWPVPAATFAVALTLYLLTLAPGLTWQHFGADGGELISASYTLGIAHPPGYPLYILLGKLFSLLPLGPVAWRYNLFSAVCMAAAAAVVAATVRRLQLSATVAVAAGLTFACTRLVWSQAIIAEVYALNLLLLALLLWQLARPAITPRAALFAGLLFGLSMTTHLTSLLSAPLLLLLPPSVLGFTLPGVLIGLLPLAVLPLLAAGNSPVVWGDATTPQGWWWLVSGRIYRPNVFGYDPRLRLIELAPMLLRQFAGIGWLLLIAAVWRRSSSRLPPRLLTLVALLYGIYALSYDADDYVVNFLPAVLLLTLALAPALQRLGAGALLLPLLLIGINFNAVNLHGEQQVHRLAAAGWAAVPAGAVVLTPGDQTIFSLWYYQHVVGERSDVTLVDENLFAFGWYRQRLQRQHPDLGMPAGDDIQAFRRANSDRPICRLSLAEQTISCTPAAVRP